MATTRSAARPRRRATAAVTIPARRFTAVEPIGHAEAMRIAAEEYRRMDAVLASIGDDDWTRPTDCTAWTVHDLVCHLAATAALTARPVGAQVAYARAIATALRAHRDPLDVYNETGIAPRRSRPGARVVAEFREQWPRALRARTYLPPPMRWTRVPLGGAWMPVGRVADVLMTRDVWIHRVDLRRALEHPVDVDAEHDGRIVADIAAEWARRHGRPVALALDGPAGGGYVQGPAGERTLVHLDAVDFARAVSGRGSPDGVLGTRVMF